MEQQDFFLAGNVGPGDVSSLPPPLRSTPQQTVSNVNAVSSLPTLQSLLHVVDEDASREPAFLTQTFSTIEEAVFYSKSIQ